MYVYTRSYIVEWIFQLNEPKYTNLSDHIIDPQKNELEPQLSRALQLSNQMGLTLTFAICIPTSLAIEQIKYKVIQYSKKPSQRSLRVQQQWSFKVSEFLSTTCAACKDWSPKTIIMGSFEQLSLETFKQWWSSWALSSMPQGGHKILSLQALLTLQVQGDPKKM